MSRSQTSHLAENRAIPSVAFVLRRPWATLHTGQPRYGRAKPLLLQHHAIPRDPKDLQLRQRLGTHVDSTSTCVVPSTPSQLLQDRLCRLLVAREDHRPHEQWKPLWNRSGALHANRANTGCNVERRASTSRRHGIGSCGGTFSRRRLLRRRSW